MTTSEYVSAGQAGGAPVESGDVQLSAPAPAVGGFINQIVDIIFDLTKGRASQLDGRDWASFDAAIRGLHSAVVALEEIGMTGAADRAIRIPCPAEALSATKDPISRT